MAIRRFIRERAFECDTVAVLTGAFDDCIRRLQLSDRDDPITELLAKSIISAWEEGEHDHARLCSRALQELGIKVSSHRSAPRQ